MNGRIDIDGTYFIDVDDFNWILKKQVLVAPTLKDGTPSKNAGKTREATLGYCSSLGSALIHYADHLEKDGIADSAGSMTIQQVIDELKAIREKIKRAYMVEPEE